jgi:hypothetical protein
VPFKIFKGVIRAIKKTKGKYDNYNIKPAARQGLLHWGYELTEKDFFDYI